jgi:hypothetical protein
MRVRYSRMRRSAAVPADGIETAESVVPRRSESPFRRGGWPHRTSGPAVRTDHGRYFSVGIMKKSLLFGVARNENR